MNSSLYSRTPLTLRWKISPSPNVPSSWNSPYNHSSLLNQLFKQAVPHHGTPCCSSAYSYSTHFGFWAYSSITPLIPTDPLFPPHLQSQRPYHLGEDITAVRRGTHFVMVEARDHDHYWITCQVDYTGVKFSNQVDWGLVIDPNPQDMLSWLDQVGSLIWLWWGHLSKIAWQSWRMRYCGDWEGRCKGEASAEKG